MLKGHLLVKEPAEALTYQHPGRPTRLVLVDMIAPGTYHQGLG